MRRITTAEAIGTTGPMPFNFEEYDFLCRKLDHDFGGPIFTNEMAVKRNGQRSFKLILEYLANRGKGSCMEIAEYETKLHTFSKKPSTMRAIADKIKRFIEQHQNLQIFTSIETEITSQNSAKGRPPTQYRLTIFGVLYAIHFLSKNQWFSPAHSTMIDNITKNYSRQFPLLFLTFNDGPKIFEMYNEECVKALLQIAKEKVLKPIPPKSLTYSDLLWETIPFIVKGKRSGPVNTVEETEKQLADEGRMEKQLTVAFFAVFLSELGGREDSKEIWLKIVNSDPELTKFFQEHLKFSHKVHHATVEGMRNLASFIS